jgi:hypothetical protein
MKKTERKKEFIVVGGGTAGILATYRLIELGYKVTLIDLRAGNGSTQSESNAVWSQLCNDNSITQSVLTEPQSHLYQRSIKYVFGRSLGGTSNINASLHHLGDLEVFNKYWPESWNSKIMRSYETILDSMIPSKAIVSSGLLQEIVQSCSSKEIYRCLFEPQNNKRWNHSSLLKKEWITDGSLGIIEGKVKKILFQAKTATHILMESGQQIIVPSNSEVILTAGVFGTPEILANSGILSVHQNSNNPNERSLQKVDIGENLQDHCLLGTVFFGSWKSQWKTTVPYPNNCVHGIIPLNRTSDGDNDPPSSPTRFLSLKFLIVSTFLLIVFCLSFFSLVSCQLLVMDGRIIVGLIDNLVPKFRKSRIFNNFLRPLIVSIISVSVLFCSVLLISCSASLFTHRLSFCSLVYC